MTLTLNVFDKEGKGIEKTYRCEDFRILTGVCEDILDVVDIDGMLDQGMKTEELGQAVMKIVLKGYPKFRTIIMQTFDGISEEEYKRTDITEVGKVIVSIVLYTLTNLFDIKTPSKNLPGSRRGQ